MAGRAAISRPVIARIRGLAPRYLALLAAVFLLLALYSGYWFLAAGWVRQAIVDWSALQRGNGAEVEFQRLRVTGFPFRLIATLDEPSYAEPATLERFAWRADRLVGYLQPWNFRHVLVALAGRHHISLRHGELDRRIEIDIRQGMASYQAGGDGGLQRLSVVLDQVAIDDRLVTGELRAEHAELHIRPGSQGRQPRWDAAFSASRAQAALLAGLPLGPDLSEIEIETTLAGSLPQAPFPIAVALWRDAGGTLELRKFRVNWGDLKLEGEGTLALDAEMRPLGALTARIHKHERLIELAQSGGQLTPNAATGARLVLGLLAAGNGGVLTVPVRLQDGLLRVGPAVLARLNPLLPDAGRNPAPGSPAPRQ